MFFLEKVYCKYKSLLNQHSYVFILMFLKNTCNHVTLVKFLEKNSKGAMLMEKIKMYVIRDAKYPQWYFQHIKDYSSVMGYLAKNHPRYTHKFTTDIKQAMHFKTPNEILEFIKEHAIEGTIVKDPYQERISKTAFKYMGENYGEAITYIHGMIEDSSEKMLAASKALKVNANTLIKFMKDPYSIAAHIRDRIVENLVNLEKAVKAIG